MKLLTWTGKGAKWRDNPFFVVEDNAYGICAYRSADRYLDGAGKPAVTEYDEREESTARPVKTMEDHHPLHQAPHRGYITRHYKDLALGLDL